MKIIFFLPTGMIEWQVPDNIKDTFNFQAFVTNVRANGFFFAEGLYIRHEALVGVSSVADDASLPIVRKDLN